MVTTSQRLQLFKVKKGLNNLDDKMFYVNNRVILII